MNEEFKALFREEARRIVSRDRSARKHGFSNNLSGDITTALVSAFKMGSAHERNPEEYRHLLPENGLAIAWELIPPTSRAILEMLSFGYSRRWKQPSDDCYELQQYFDEGNDRLRWMVVNHVGELCASERTYAQKGVGPLLRKELLIPKDGDETRLVLSEAGAATCRLYWARSDRDDPTLPIKSMR